MDVRKRMRSRIPALTGTTEDLSQWNQLVLYSETYFCIELMQNGSRLNNLGTLKRDRSCQQAYNRDAAGRSKHIIIMIIRIAEHCRYHRYCGEHYFQLRMMDLCPCEIHLTGRRQYLSS